MNILQIHTRYQQSGGEDTVVAAEAELLRGAGHTVTLFEAHNDDGRTAGVQLGGAVWNPRTARRLVSHITTQRPDVAHIHNTWFAMSPSVLRVLGRAGVPTVMTLHNYRLTCANALLLRDGSPCETCVEGSPLQAIRFGCYRSRPQTAVAAFNVALHRRIGTWGRHIDVFLALTEFMKDIMVRSGLPEEKIAVKPNFTSDPGPRNLAAAASDVVIFVGRLSPEKGIDRLVDAWHSASPSGLSLKIIGDGPLRSELERQATASIDFVGAVDSSDVSRHLLTARAMAFPSIWYEGFGLTIIEAFAAGLPVLANNLGAMSSLVKPLGQQWLLDNSERWVDALRELTDSRKIASGAIIARKTFERNYTGDASLTLLEKAYAQAAEERG